MCCRVRKDSCRPTDVIALHSLRCLGHVLHIPTDRLPFRALALVGQGWRKQRGGEV